VTVDVLQRAAEVRARYKSLAKNGKKQPLKGSYEAATYELHRMLGELIDATGSGPTGMNSQVSRAAQLLRRVEGVGRLSQLHGPGGKPWTFHALRQKMAEGLVNGTAREEHEIAERIKAIRQGETLTLQLDISDFMRMAWVVAAVLRNLDVDLGVALAGDGTRAALDDWAQEPT
jgi:hypothetical protein